LLLALFSEHKAARFETQAKAAQSAAVATDVVADVVTDSVTDSVTASVTDTALDAVADAAPDTSILTQRPVRSRPRRPRDKKHSDSSKRTKRVRNLIIVAAAAFVGVLSFILISNISFALEIPDGGVTGVVVLSGNTATPENFISPNQEMYGINAVFRYPEAVDFTAAGRQDVVLTLRSGWRVKEAVAPLYVFTPASRLFIEAGTPTEYILPQFFLQHSNSVGSDTNFDIQIHSGFPTQDILEVGVYTLHMSVNGAFFNTVLEVEDTTPPTANLKDVTVPMGQEVTTEDFIVDMFDISPIVDVSFVQEPYLFMPGVQPVEIKLTDYFGNFAVYTASLFIFPNTEPPRILGTQDLVIQIGSPIIFRRGVSAEDAFGRPLEFFVDSDVNIHELGEYSVTYNTIDAWGGRVEATHTVTIIDVEPERVRYLADTVLAGILREGMTQVEQARTIFDWTQNNVAYAANISRGNIYEGAYQAIRNRRGDCFVFFSISAVLLTQAGIPNLHIQRIPGTQSRHSWNLINPDDLGWHHFDATPMMPVHNQRLNRFMFTSSDARLHTEMIARELGTRDYYTYDPALFPTIVQ